MRLFEVFFNVLIARINWSGLKYLLSGRNYELSDKEIVSSCDLLLKGRYIGLSVRKTHLTTYLIRLAELLVTGKYGYWTHAWINAEDEENDSSKIEIIEAIGKGVIPSPFWRVLDCDSVVFLRPKWIDENEWERICTIIPSYLGKKYDNYFNHKDSSRVSCVELIYQLMLEVDQESLPNLQRMVEYYGKLTPDMLYSCGDFEIVYEVKK